MLKTKVVEKIKNTQLMFNIFFNSCFLSDSVGKYGRSRQATYDNMITVHTLCMLGN